VFAPEFAQNTPFGERRFAPVGRRIGDAMTTSPATETSDGAATYRICVKGHFGRGLRAALEPLKACEVHGRTVFEGLVRDQAALYGLLRRLECTGCTLLSVLKVDE